MSGTADKTKGRLKQAAGDLTGNDELEREGEIDETSGKVKEAVGTVKDKAEGAIDAVKDRLKRD